MADRKTITASTSPVRSVAREGETRFGATTTKDKAQGVLYVGSNLASRGTVFALDAINSAGAVTTFYLWVKVDGKLYISSTDPTSNTETASGTVVGSQS
jgi:hypothetical protein